MTHILITGGNGLIGSHLVRRLLELKKENQWQEEILCLVRATSDLSPLKGLDVKLILGDLREPDSLVPAVTGATYIYHVAAELYGTSRSKFIETNATGTKNLLKAASLHAKDSLKRFLLVSSLAAAGPAAGPEPINEEREFSKPVSWYAESKQKAEQFAHQYQDQFPITIVRPSGVYGPRDPVFAALFKSVRMRIHPLLGFRKQYSGVIYAPDLVEGITAAALNDSAIGETFFLTNPKSNTTGEFLNTLGEAVGKKVHITIPSPVFVMKLLALFMELVYHFTRKLPNPTLDKVRDLRQTYWLCTPQKAKELLGWVAKHSLLEGAKNTHQYMLQQERTAKEMACESKKILFLKYVMMGILFGTVIELLAEFGKVYHFEPWYFMFGVIIGMWGLFFGYMAMLTRSKSMILQFLIGFVFLFGAELLNHYTLHRWSFYPGDMLGLSAMTPLWRAFWLGFGTGFVIPLYNAIQRQLFKYKSRVRRF